MNYCSNCGVKLEANASFCHNCGIKLAATYNTCADTTVQKQKNKFIAGLLAIFLGTLGIHNFYLGYNKKGITQLLLFVFFMGWVSFIWSIVDAIRIFTDKIDRDAKGVPLSDNL